MMLNYVTFWTRYRAGLTRQDHITPQSILFYKKKNSLKGFKEEKAKVVAVVWGMELIQFLAARILKKKDEQNKGFLAKWML